MENVKSHILTDFYENYELLVLHCKIHIGLPHSDMICLVSVATSGASKVRCDLYFTLQNNMSDKNLQSVKYLYFLVNYVRVKTYVTRPKHERERSCVANTRARARFSESSAAKHMLKCMTGRLDVQQHEGTSTLARSDFAKHVVT